MAATDQDRNLPAGRALTQYWRYALQALFLGVFLVAALTFLFAWQTEPQESAFRIGEASPVEVLAKQRTTFISEIATEVERNRAASAVKEIYSPPDAAITRQRLVLAEDTLRQITIAREMPGILLSERISSIEQIQELNLTPTVIRTILTFDQGIWQSTITATLRVLEQVMNEGVRDSQLAEARTRLSAFLSMEILPAEQERVVIAIVRPLIAPNSFYDAKATAEARQKVRDETKPVQRTIEKGQAILRAGDIVTPTHLEQLTALGLMRGKRGWEDWVGAALVALMIVALPGSYIQRVHPHFWLHWRRTLLVCTVMLASVALAKFMVPGHTLLPYLFPMAAISMSLTLLLADTSISLVITAVLSLGVGFIAGGSLELTILVFINGAVGALGVSRRERTSAFVLTGLLVAGTSIMTSLAFRLYSRNYDLLAISQLTLIGLANGILSASTAFAAFSWVGRLFGVTTSLHLLELARPTQPLLRRLALKAPGTYHHTLIVANMAEQAAEAIGADSLLTRIGAYYHDIGKTLRPYFFIENSLDRENIHDRLDPKTSAQIIISHTKDGLELAKKHGLPAEVQAIIAQHHGTTLASFFYQQANQQAPEGETIDEADYRYPGPKSQSKEAAIVMLADVEAAVRSARPSSLEETERLVRQFINVRLVSGELDECDLTLRDLDKIRQAFVSVLKGVFHPRIQYPVEAKEPGRVVGPLVPKSAVVQSTAVPEAKEQSA